jgi:hypothetical protein
VDGGPVDERRRREPRAHRFQAVESTLIIRQPSPFAGWRSAGGLVPKRNAVAVGLSLNENRWHEIILISKFRFERNGRAA